MKQVTNCKNCGAALDIWKPHCQFCGTKNVNLTALDLNSGEPANFIFKMPSNIKVVSPDGADIYLTTLAIPSLETIEMVNDIVDIYDGYHAAPVAKYTNNMSSVAMNLKLTTVNKYPNNTLGELQVGDNEC